MEKNEILDELEEVIGPEAAKRLVEHYSGSNLYIPKSIGISWKHQKIREEFKNGLGYRELAMRYGYSELHIRRIVHRWKNKNSQKNRLTKAPSWIYGANLRPRWRHEVQGDTGSFG